MLYYIKIFFVINSLKNLVTHAKRKGFDSAIVYESKKETHSLRILLTDLVQNLKHNNRTDSSAFCHR
jgi:hypothetical protein